MQFSTRWGAWGGGDPFDVFDLAPELAPPDIQAERARLADEANKMKQASVSALFDQLDRQNRQYGGH